MRDDLPSPWDWANEHDPPADLSEVLERADGLWESGRSNDAITLLDEAIQHADVSGDLDDESVLALHLARARRLGEASRFTDLLEACRQSIDFAWERSLARSHLAALAVILHALTLAEIGRKTESMVELDEIAETFGHEDDPALRAVAASALRYKARELAEVRSLDDGEEALATLTSCYGSDVAPAVRAEAALGMAELAIYFIQAGKRRRALRLASQMLARYEGSRDADIRAALAVAYVSKIHILPRQGRLIAAIRCILAFVRFVGTDPEPKVVQAVLSHHPKGEKLLRHAATFNS